MSPESAFQYSYFIGEKIKAVAPSVFVEPGKTETFWCEGKEEAGIVETKSPGGLCAEYIIEKGEFVVKLENIEPNRDFRDLIQDKQF
jgi:hypothetical protein